MSRHFPTLKRTNHQRGRRHLKRLARRIGKQLRIASSRALRGAGAQQRGSGIRRRSSAQLRHATRVFVHVSRRIEHSFKARARITRDGLCSQFLHGIYYTSNALKAARQYAKRAFSAKFSCALFAQVFMRVLKRKHWAEKKAGEAPVTDRQACGVLA